jgi:hypothetical protein
MTERQDRAHERQMDMHEATHGKPRLEIDGVRMDRPDHEPELVPKPPPPKCAKCKDLGGYWKDQWIEEYGRMRAFPKWVTCGCQTKATP